MLRRSVLLRTGVALLTEVTGTEAFWAGVWRQPKEGPRLYVPALRCTEARCTALRCAALHCTERPPLRPRRSGPAAQARPLFSAATAPQIEAEVKDFWHGLETATNAKQK